VFTARGVVSGAVHEDVFDRLDRFAALAGDLIRCVLGEEALGVCANEGVSCDDTVESRYGASRETRLSCCGLHVPNGKASRWVP